MAKIQTFFHFPILLTKATCKVIQIIQYPLQTLAHAALFSFTKAFKCQKSPTCQVLQGAKTAGIEGKVPLFSLQFGDLRSDLRAHTSVHPPNEGSGKEMQRYQNQQGSFLRYFIKSYQKFPKNRDRHHKLHTNQDWGGHKRVS